MKRIIKKLDDFRKERLNDLKNEKFKLGIQQAIPFWIISLITGIVAVGYAKMFAWVEHLMLVIFEFQHWLIFIISPLFMLLGWWVVKRFAPYARGSGIPQVMASIELINEKPAINVSRFLSIKVAIIKIISSLFMVFGGAAIGREGPTIQIASSLFKFVNRLIPKSWPKLRRTNLIVTGAAAGLAAAFNTPLGGIVFALEELSKTHISHYRTALFSAVIIAGLTAQAILGPYLYLGYPTVTTSNWYMFFLIMLVAVLGGISASILGKLILKALRWKELTFTKTIHHIIFITLTGLALASLAFFINISVTGSGKELMQYLLFENNKNIPWYEFPLRFMGPLLSFTTGGAGGIFAPGLSAGAALGATVGNWFSLESGNTNLLILAGMVAFLTGITRTPFTSAILVLEMTDRHSLIFYLMLSSMIAGLASLLVDKKSFYDHLKNDYISSFKSTLKQPQNTPLQKI